VSDIFIVDSLSSGGRASATAEQESAFMYGSMAVGGYLAHNIGTTTPNAVKEVLRIQAYVSIASTGTSAGFGPAFTLYGESGTDATYRKMGQIENYWGTATDASRTVEGRILAFDSAGTREPIAWGANGSAPTLSFYGATRITRPTTGIAEAAFTENSGGAVVNVDSTFGGYTLQQVVQALQNIGILT
jgi:hypothetical protein